MKDTVKENETTGRLKVTITKTQRGKRKGR
jgi:hypothetical protein